MSHLLILVVHNLINVFVNVRMTLDVQSLAL